LILTSLLILASQTGGLDAVIKRYSSFMAAHPVLSADVAISGSKSGSGAITLVHSSHAPVKVDWHCTVDGAPYHFTSNGKVNIEAVSSEAAYDRLPAFDGPMPAGRIELSFGYPAVLVTGDTPFGQLKSDTVMSVKGNLIELKATRRSPLGDVIVTAAFAPDGRVTHFSIEKGFPGNMRAEVCDFSNYKFGAAVVPSPFDVNPPIGYAPYAFDLPVLPVADGSGMPKAPLLGTEGSTLEKVANAPIGVIAFLDDPMPEGLKDSLIRLNQFVPVTAIKMKGAKIELGKLPTFEMDESGFDIAGVSVTPQFYLVKHGKLVQAWQGFREDNAAKFEHEIHDAITPG
jgi:hypothetical protein